jgi:hypothetical protein
VLIGFRLVVQLAGFAESFQVVDHHHDPRDLADLVEILLARRLLQLFNLVFFLLHLVRSLLKFFYLVIELHDLKFKFSFLFCGFVLDSVQLLLLGPKFGVEAVVEVFQSLVAVDDSFDVVVLIRVGVLHFLQKHLVRLHGDAFLLDPFALLVKDHQLLLLPRDLLKSLPVVFG